VELPFEDRTQAGRLLAERLRGYARPDALVLALPRGGVPVAFEVARALRAPLDVFLVRKLGVPGREELALGAIATGGALVVDRGLVAALGIQATDIAGVISLEKAELARRERLYREGRPPLVVKGKTVIVIDDGVATGSTMLAAITALASQEPSWLVVAVPVAPPDTVVRLRREVDEVVTLAEPDSFGAVGYWYLDFAPVTDERVRELLSERTADRKAA
jgi:predicted phosphoribosyltransferase